MAWAVRQLHSWTPGLPQSPCFLPGGWAAYPLGISCTASAPAGAPRMWLSPSHTLPWGRGAQAAPLAYLPACFSLPGHPESSLISASRALPLPRSPGRSGTEARPLQSWTRWGRVYSPHEASRP